MPPAVVYALVLAGVSAAAWTLLRSVRARSAAAATAATEPAAPSAARVPSAPPAAHAAGADGAADATAPLAAPDILDRLYALAFGLDRLGSAPADEIGEIGAVSAQVLHAVAADPRYAPRRPLLLPQLVRAVNDDEVSRRELSTIIARDPALTGSLLKLANGALYRVSERPVESVDRAVALLGTEGIRSLVAVSLVQPVFRLSAAQFPQFPEIAWEHTTRCSAAAEAHAAVVEDSDPFAAQLLGLTLGLGTIVTFRVVLDVYSRAGRAPQAAVVAALLERLAPPVGSRIAASWELSGRILSALEEQSPTEPREPTALGRSLGFGRLIGALAVLHTAARVSDAVAKASMLASGATEFQFERIWGRLTGRMPVTVERRGPAPRR